MKHPPIPAVNDTEDCVQWYFRPLLEDYLLHLSGAETLQPFSNPGPPPSQDTRSAGRGCMNRSTEFVPFAEERGGLPYYEELGRSVIVRWTSFQTASSASVG